MVVKKWGQQVLDTFVINRAMVEMDEVAQVDKDFVDTGLKAAPEMSQGSLGQVGGESNAAGVLSSASSSCGGDSHAGCSDANLENRWTLPPGQALCAQADGSGEGWVGAEGDRAVRQWLCPKPSTEKSGEADAVEGAEPSQVSPPETQLMDVEENGADGEVARPAEIAEGAGDLARAGRSTEGHQVQLDLKHWLK